MTRPITIFYEDSAAPGSVAGYGPHVLVRQCVADDLGVATWQLSHLESIPRRGNQHIRAECRENPSRFVRDGRWAFAVYDGDRLATLLGQRGDACKTALKSALLSECKWREQLRIVVLERNLESLLRVVLKCAPEAADERTRALALERKSLAERDVILKCAAGAGAEGRRVRDCVRQAMPSFDYLIRKLVEACRA